MKTARHDNTTGATAPELRGEALAIEKLGWDAGWAEAFSSFREQGLECGRVAVEGKHEYVIFASSGEISGQVSGKLLHQAPSRAELPKVGDWVAFSVLPRENKALIHAVLPRRTRLARKVPGRELQEQVLVTNVNTAFVVQSLDRRFNPRLLERHLLMVVEGGIKPAVVLNKSDLCPVVHEKVEEAAMAAVNAPVLALSAKTGEGVNRLSEWIRPRETVVFLGPSGVGKSTLINALFGEEIQPTAEVRETDFKGRHTTTWRELLVLPNGGLVIDTPGVREFHIWLSGEGVHEAFPDIETLALKCHFTNCTHTVEKKCAVQAALATGELPRERYANFLKLKRELDYLHKARQGRVRPGKGLHVRFTRKTRR